MPGPHQSRWGIITNLGWNYSEVGTGCGNIVRGILFLYFMSFIPQVEFSCISIFSGLRFYHVYTVCLHDFEGHSGWRQKSDLIKISFHLQFLMLLKNTSFPLFPCQFCWSYIILLSHHDLQQLKLLKVPQNFHHMIRATHTGSNTKLNTNELW